MLEIIPSEAPNVIGFRMTGPIDNAGRDWILS
jgi:hypothetical protein